MKILTVETSRVSYGGPDRLDITAKSAQGIGTVLAPTWAMVTAVKAHTITPQEYSDRYHALLRERYRDPARLAQFLNIINRGHVVLCCYCKVGAFCHRHLAKNVIMKIAEKHGFAAFDGGEIT